MTVLHVVHKDMKLISAYFLKKESREAKWEAFVRILVAPHIGYPDNVATDQVLNSLLSSRTAC